MQRRITRVVKIGSLSMGGNYPIRVQSMTNLPTSDISGQIQQIIACVEAGAEYMRITVPSQKDIEHFAEIKKGLRKLGIVSPLIADVHFNPKIAMMVAQYADKVRINPGNFSNNPEDPLKQLISVCKNYNTALRIGTNHGSLAARVMKKFGDTPEGMVFATLEAVEICRTQNFHNLILSLKSSNVRVMVEATRLLASQLDEKGWNYPIHLGVTEAGNAEEGRIKSAVGIGSLLVDGIGDTIRVSLTEDPQFEIPVAYNILQAARARITKTDYIACPGCGRTLFDLQGTLIKVKEATAHLSGLKIAVMGCIVNGPGEMADADFGYVGAGNGKVHLYKGKNAILKNIPEEQAINELLRIINSETQAKG